MSITFYSHNTLIKYRVIIYYFNWWYFIQRVMSSSTSQPHPDISHGELKVFALKSISNKHLISVMHPDVCWVFSLSPSCSGYRVSSRVSQSVVLCLRFQAQQDHFQAYNPSPSAHPWSGLAHFPIKKITDYECCERFNFKTEINIFFSEAM